MAVKTGRLTKKQKKNSYMLRENGKKVVGNKIERAESTEIREKM